MTERAYNKIFCTTGFQQCAESFPATYTAVILRSRAFARRLEGLPLALVAHPSRLAEDGEHLRVTAALVSGLHPRPRNDRGGAFGEQFKPDGATEFARAICGACVGDFDERAAIFIQHRGSQAHLGARDGRIA